MFYELSYSIIGFATAASEFRKVIRCSVEPEMDGSRSCEMPRLIDVGQCAPSTRLIGPRPSGRGDVVILFHANFAIRRSLK
jgi:hypothetical protein